MRRLTAFLLSFLLLSAVSCSETTAAPEETSPAQEQPVEEVSETEAPTIADTVKETYSNVDYGGYEFHILGNAPGSFFYYKISDQANEIWYETQTGEIYTDAVYDRNIMTEDLLNIKIVPEWDSNSDTTPRIKKLVAAGDDNIDAALGGMAYHINIAATGNLYNLYTVDGLELEQSWFDQAIVRNYSYHGDKLYAIAGAYNVFDDYAVPVVFYGKQIMRENGLNDPANLVAEGNWTIDEMMTMGEVVTRDLDGNGKMTIADAWGFLDNSGALRHLAEGVGHTITRVDSDGVPYLNCLTPEYLDAVEKIYNRVICSDATMETSNATQVVIMKEERGLFYYELLGCINEFRDMESDFSLLPLPKLDTTQEHYVTPVNSVWCTALAVPITAADTARVGTVLNVLSAFSVETVNRTLYELILSSKLIREEMSLVMLDYVWADKTYCWGNGYSWASSIDSVFSSQYSAKSFIMASQLEKQTKVITKSFDKFLGQFDELP